MAFLFEKLNVYRKALEWVSTVSALASKQKDNLPNPFREQLMRAALSIPLNIAEGNGRWHKADKQQFYRISRGSIFECVAIIQVLQRQGTISDSCYRAAYSQLEILSKMLSGLIVSLENQNSAPEKAKVETRV